MKGDKSVTMKKRLALVLIICAALMLTACADKAQRGEQLVTEGYDYLAGANGKERDIHKALEKFEQADSLGNLDGSFFAGWVYDTELIEGKENDFTKAREYYEKCPEDNLAANICLGFIYLNGQDIEADETKAEEYFVKAAKKVKAGEYDVEKYSYKTPYLVGALYEFGYAIEQDYTKAKDLYELAADAGNPYAMSYLGEIYLRGYGVDPDYAKALEWFEKGATLDNEIAYAFLGSMYQYGDGVDQDYDKAMEYYTKAVDFGSGDAMADIGFMYENGIGVEKDEAKALEWYKKSVDLGYDIAQERYDALKQGE